MDLSTEDVDLLRRVAATGAEGLVVRSRGLTELSSVRWLEDQFLATVQVIDTWTHRLTVTDRGSDVLAHRDEGLVADDWFADQ